MKGYLPADHGELAQWIGADHEIVESTMPKLAFMFKLNKAGDKYFCTALNAEYTRCKNFSRAQRNRRKGTGAQDTEKETDTNHGQPLDGSTNTNNENDNEKDQDQDKEPNEYENDTTTVVDNPQQQPDSGSSRSGSGLSKINSGETRKAMQPGADTDKHGVDAIFAMLIGGYYFKDPDIRSLKSQLEHGKCYPEDIQRAFGEFEDAMQSDNPPKRPAAFFNSLIQKYKRERAA